MQIIDSIYSVVLNLTAMEVAEYSQLEMFNWKTNFVSGIAGNFCTNHSHSELKLISLTGTLTTIEMIPPDIFDHCVSLEYLSIISVGLVYLPESLFDTHVSQLETLRLIGNRLSSNTSWSDVLMPLQELKYLNLSMNMLTLWTYNLSSLGKLEMLDLSHNAIREISHIAFMNMTKLKYLSLADNNLAFLTNEVKRILMRIALVHLASNNISQLNMSEDILSCDTSVLFVSVNSLIQLDLPRMKKCTQPCGKISLFADYNFLQHFTLPCSSTQQFATVSLVHNKLIDFPSIFPDVLLQQCSVEILNVSHNYFHQWLYRNFNTTIKVFWLHISKRKAFTHRIKTLDMTRCGITVIGTHAFEIFTIGFLDLRGNTLVSIPRLYEDSPYPGILDIQSNPLQCSCQLLWLKHYIEKMTSTSKYKIRVTHCMDALLNTNVELLTEPDFMFMCERGCSHQIEQQCDKEHRCYGTSLKLDAIVCLTSFNTNKLSSSLITAEYALHISGFSLSTLRLLFVEPHNLTHLNLTSCNIRVIPETTFINTPHLQLLVLANNAIENLVSDTFHPLFLLKYLDLSNNQLLSFDAELLLPLFRPETICLHDNKLKQLSMDTLFEFTILSTLSLYDNPWTCDCNDTFWTLDCGTTAQRFSPQS